MAAVSSCPPFCDRSSGDVNNMAFRDKLIRVSDVTNHRYCDSRLTRDSLSYFTLTRVLFLLKVRNYVPSSLNNLRTKKEKQRKTKNKKELKTKGVTTCGVKG